MQAGGKTYLASNGIKELRGFYGTTATKDRATLNKAVGSTIYSYGDESMKRHRLTTQGSLCAVYCFFLSTIVLTVGCDSALSRGTALDLLKKSSDETLGFSPITLRLETSFGLPDVVASKEEVERTAPLNFNSFPKGSLLDVKFAQLLEKKGIIKMTYVQNAIFYGKLLDLRYEPVPNPDAQLVERKIGFQDSNTVVFTVARPSITEVKGIAQEGNNAKVETLVSFIPTETYNRLAQCARELFQQEGLAQGDCGNCAAGDVLEVGGTLNQTERTYQFAKYDDGWRVMKWR